MDPHPAHQIQSITAHNILTDVGPRLRPPLGPQVIQPGGRDLGNVVTFHFYQACFQNRLLH